jgi:PAS domain S-box-containing protein
MDVSSGPNDDSGPAVCSLKRAPADVSVHTYAAQPDWVGGADSAPPCPSAFPDTFGRFRDFVESGTVALIISDTSGIIVQANRQAERLFGYACHELSGQNIEALVPDRFRGQNHVQHACSAKQSETRSVSGGLMFYGRRKDGSEVPLEISLSSINSSGGLLVISAIRDISDRMRGNVLQAHLASIMDSTEDAILSSDMYGTIRSWNRGAEKLFGYTARDVMGLSIAALIPPESSGQALNLLKRINQGETITALETEWIHKDGRRPHVSTTFSPIRDTEGRVVGACAIARDIAERKRMERDLERAKKDLSEFAYAAAHDLQEPLRIISISMALLKKLSSKNSDLSEFDWDSDSEAMLIEETISSARLMLSMVSGLLTYSRLGDQVNDTAVPIDSNQILQKVLKSVDQDVRDSQAQIICGGLPHLKTDPEHLTQLLQNLVCNALKYRSTDRTPVVQISALRGEKGWVFAVADNGIGFDPVYAKRIFGIFKRLHVRDEYPGVGIGLALCERIVSKYRGEIWAEGRVGNGATFRFTLPTAEIIL